MKYGNAHVAQSVEHFLGKGEVTGSNPVAGSRGYSTNVQDALMAKNKVITHLMCTACKDRNYTQRIGKKRTIGSLNLKKFCSKCKKHHVHKETK